MLLAGTAVFYFTNLDIFISGIFFDGQWYLKDKQPYVFLYYYGVHLGLIISLLSFVVLIAGYFQKKSSSFRKFALFLVLVMLLGPGILVNSIFKENYGRPRPRHITNFGGEEKFLKVWEIGQTKGNSFPSGHASAAFYLISLYYVLKDKRKKAAIYLFGFGIFYGLLMSITRIVQGGHFASDTLWSFGMVWITCEILDKIILKNKRSV